MAETPVDVTIGTNHIHAQIGTFSFTSKLVDGKFPDYERVIPQNQNKTIKLDRSLLQHCLQRAAILTNEKFRGVRLVLSPGSLKILSANAENEEAQEELEVDYNAEELDIGFNVNYLVDVLNNVATDVIEIRLADSNSSALMMLPDNERFKYVVMPMRI
jgi:DNA polymerase-3 subunit beta